MGGYKKKCAPWSIVFSPRLARARVSLSCESACRAHAGAVCVCVCAKVSLSCQKTFGVISRRYLRGEQARMLSARALGQSAQAEQGTLILYSSQESAILRIRT